VESEQPRRKSYWRVLQSVWAFGPHHNGFRIRTDSVEGRIRVDSGGFRDPGIRFRKPSFELNEREFGCGG